MSKKINIAVLGPSEIAFRRFVPAVQNSEKFNLVGVAHADENEWFEDRQADKSIIENEHKKALKFSETYNIPVFESYKTVLENPEIQAVYIPLPPALHFRWGINALKSGKHILLEKPFATCNEETKTLIDEAKKRNLAVHENFAFIFHNQIDEILRVINDGEIGELRLIRTAFGFPYRGENDFRYNKKLGGSALLDCGGYPIRLANFLLGGNAKLVTSCLNPSRNHDVDVFGNATLINEKNEVAQISFGMDNSYKCEIEVWGSEGCLSTERVFSPPAEMSPQIIIKSGEKKVYNVEADDQFKNSAEFFADCINNEKLRLENYETINAQSILFDDMRVKNIFR